MATTEEYGTLEPRDRSDIHFFARVIDETSGAGGRAAGAWAEGAVREARLPGKN
jgi:hypothetical protein